MSIVLANKHDYHSMVLEMAKTSISIDICSYGMYSGIWKNHNGEGFIPNEISALLDCIHNTEVKNRIIINVSKYWPCYKCGSINFYKMQQWKIIETIKRWKKKVNFYLTTDCHFKTVLCPNDRVIVGGHNPMTPSDWRDLSIYTEEDKVYETSKRMFEIVLLHSMKATNIRNVEDYFRSLKQDHFKEDGPWTKRG